MEDGAAVVLASDMDGDGILIQSLENRLVSDSGRVVGFAQMSQNNLAQVGMGDAGQQLACGRIR